MGSSVITFAEAKSIHHTLETHQVIMSGGIKIKDVISVIRQSKVDRALGLVEAPTQFRASHPKLPPNDPSYSYLKSQRSCQGSFVNAARTEKGTTFYMSQKM